MPCLDITVNVSVPVHVVEPSQHLFQNGCNDSLFQPLRRQPHFQAALPFTNDSNCYRCQKQASPELEWQSVPSSKALGREGLCPYLRMGILDDIQH